MKKKSTAAEKLSDLPRACAYCSNASPLLSENQMLCQKHGIVASGSSCRKFRYDPLKRVPSLPPQIILPEKEELGIG